MSKHHSAHGEGSVYKPPTACPCGHILYPGESVLCQECVDRIEMEVQIEMMLAGDPCFVDNDLGPEGPWIDGDMP